jgi:hypothetical protein
MMIILINYLADFTGNSSCIRNLASTEPTTEMIRSEVQKILTSEVYFYDPFAAEVLAEIIQIPIRKI